MAQQRLWLALLGILLLHSELIESKQFIVGDNEGWTFGANIWPNNKVFHARNVLVFKYDAILHNVVRVDRHGYETCTPNKKSKKYDSGLDHIKLHRGMNYFICSVPGHCQNAGMKMAIKAL